METYEFNDAIQLTREQRSKVVQAMANGMIDLFHKSMTPNVCDKNIAMHGLLADATLVAIKKLCDKLDDAECSEVYTSLQTMAEASDRSKESLMLAIGLAFMAGSKYGGVEKLEEVPEELCTFQQYQETVHGKDVDVRGLELNGDNEFCIMAGTNGYHYTHNGHHDTETVLSFRDVCATDWEVEVLEDGYGRTRDVDFYFHGNSELHHLVHALDYILHHLKKQIEELSVRE